MFLVKLVSPLVCKQDYAKTIQLILVAHEPWKKPLDFGGNLGHITLGLHSTECHTSCYCCCE